MMRESADEMADRFSEQYGVSKAHGIQIAWAFVALAHAAHLPRHLLPGLLASSERWLLAPAPLVSLEEHRLAAWRYVKEHYGSTDIPDATAKAVRLMIGVAEDGELESDLDLAVEFLDELLAMPY